MEQIQAIADMLGGEKYEAEVTVRYEQILGGESLVFTDIRRSVNGIPEGWTFQKGSDDPWDLYLSRAARYVLHAITGIDIYE